MTQQRSVLKEARFLAKLRKKLDLPREASMARIVGRIGELRAAAKLGPGVAPTDARELLNLVDSLLVVTDAVRKGHAPEPVALTPAMRALKMANSGSPATRAPA